MGHLARRQKSWKETYQGWYCGFITVKPRYKEALETMKITLLYQGKKPKNIMSWDQQNYLVIRGFCYILPLYNEVPLYLSNAKLFKSSSVKSMMPSILLPATWC